MNSYQFGEPQMIPVDKIQYGEMEYNFFYIREVLKDNKPIGEFHIKLKDKSSVKNAKDYFQRQFVDCEVGLIDPDCLLNLEYSIYMIVRDKMILNDITNIFVQIDNELVSKKEDK